MKKFETLLIFLILLWILAGCASEEPNVQWHSNIFTAIGDDFYYEGSIHNGGKGTATDVQLELLFPEELIQRKRSEVNPIRLGKIGPEEIGNFSGKILFDFSDLTKSEIMELVDDLEVKIRWSEDGEIDEDFLRRKRDVQNNQAS